MSSYSTQDQIDALLRDLGPDPMTVCDMDGNVMLGFNFTGDTPCRLAGTDNPAVQSIPFGTSQRAIAAMVKEGIYQQAIFADKAMDVRLPPPLVGLLNAALHANQPFKFPFLTSRSFDDAVKLLQESGVQHIERAAIVADSGATLQLNGEKISVRPLSDTERAYINGLDQLTQTLQTEIEEIIAAQGFDVDCPPLRVEHKAIASNIHYREILTATGQGEGSALDVALATHLKSRLNGYILAGPQDDAGKPTFKTLDGPATVEMKLASITKAHGLEALIKAALESSTPPSAVVFTGDDVAKGNGTPGTDYYAMVEADRLSVAYGIPVYTIHTHHPVGTMLDGTTPDPEKSPGKLLPSYAQPRIDLSVPTPVALGSLILRAHGVAQAPSVNPAASTTAPASFDLH